MHMVHYKFYKFSVTELGLGTGDTVHNNGLQNIVPSFIHHLTVYKLP